MSDPKLFQHQNVTPKFVSRRTNPVPAVVVPPLNPLVGPILLTYVKLPFRMSATDDFGPGSARLSLRNSSEHVSAVIDRLEPIYRRMRMRLQHAPYLQTVEVPFWCGEPSQKKTLRWIRVISRLGEDLVFDSRSSRRRGQPSVLLDGFHGYLHVRGTAENGHLARTYPKIIQVACWAEARRVFLNAHAEWPKAVDVILRIIDWLHACESYADSHALSEQDRLCLRQKARRPLFWLDRIARGLRRKSSRQSQLRAACNHLLRSWKPLTRHFETGVTQLDHSLADDAIRLETIAADAGLPRGDRTADRHAAIVYSLVFSCLRRGLEPSSYLQDVLFRLPTHPAEAELDALTPARWRAQRAPD